MSTLTEASAIWCELIDPETNGYVSGWGVIIPGADVPADQVAEAMTANHGPDYSRIVSETQHLHFHPRIKRCERLSGFGCGMEGEWHSHWEGVQHNPAAEHCCYTVALPVYAGEPR